MKTNVKIQNGSHPQFSVEEFKNEISIFIDRSHLNFKIENLFRWLSPNNRIRRTYKTILDQNSAYSVLDCCHLDVILL